MSRELREIQSLLKVKAEKKNIAFFQQMVPGKQKIYGVKTPELNAIARQYKVYAFDLATELWNAGALEERIIAIKIIEKVGKKDPDQTLKLFRQFSKHIDNWAVCDGMGMQFLRGIVLTHAKEIFALSEKLSHSKDPWQRRLSLVMVEWYTRKKELLPQIKHRVKQLENDKEYYVKKAIVWLKKNFAKGK